MNKKITLFLLCSLFYLTGYTQCSGGASGGALNPVPAAAFQTMGVTSGDYYTFVVAAGCMPTYTFSFCAADGGSATFDTQLTILDNTGTYANGFNDDFCGLQSHLIWTPIAAGTYRVLINTYPCAGGGTATLAYSSVLPASMTFTSCTTVQSSTATVTACDFDQTVISVQVVTSGSCSPLTLTQFQLGAGSSTSATLADVSFIHIYYTGTTNSFSTTNEFLAGGTAPAGGTNTINGSQALVSGTNYFWIAYDINPAATTSDVVDASCTQLTIGSTHVPTTTNPAGTRTINACSSYPGTSALGLKHWVKSDAGVTGSPVSAWADQSGAGVTGNMAQATVANQPSVQSGLINFQDYIRFNGTTSILTSVNTFTGTSIFNVTDNTILMIKNYKSGSVDYKWETNPTGAYRIGEEFAGSTSQRLDFSSDVGGKNNLSTTNIANIDVISEYLSNSSTLTLKLNGNTDAVLSHSLTFAPGATTSNLNLGGNGVDNPLFCQVDLAEVMTFNKALSSGELRRVESYLAMKYGMTLQNNKGAGASASYVSSTGTYIWNNHTGFHNYVIGLGRDNTAGNSGLNKLKTTSVSSLNGSTDLLTLANSSISAPAALSNDMSFLVVGNNAGSLATPLQVSYTHGGSATILAYQLSRVWATQKTGTFTGNVIMEFDMSQVNGPTGYGTNTNTDMRLLVDDNQNFGDASAGEYTILPTVGFALTGGKIDFSVPYADLQAGTGYFTLASVNGVTAPLPVHFVSVSSQCEGEAVEIDWTTAVETNSNYFRIQRAGEGNTVFEDVGMVQAANNSSVYLHYSWMDKKPLSVNAYYRIQETDFNGNNGYSDIIQQQTCSDFRAGVYPNPFSGHTTLYIESSAVGLAEVTLINMVGQQMRPTLQIQTAESGQTIQDIDFSDLSSGIYFLKLTLGEKTMTYKLIKN
jgi:hypothetical protein